MSEVIFVVEEAAEGGYTARALGTSIFTEADSLPELHNEIRDAVRCHFEEGQTPKDRALRTRVDDHERRIRALEKGREAAH